MSARLNAWLRRLGTMGILGLGVLLACAGFWFSALKPLQERLAVQRVALERLVAGGRLQPVAASGRAEELRRFKHFFPPASELTGELERLHGLARRAGLDLAQGEYRLERRAVGLWAYRVTLPVRGSYSQMREFIAAVLRDMPVAAIDALRFERKKAAASELEAQVRLTLYVRPSGESL